MEFKCYVGKYFERYFLRRIYLIFEVLVFVSLSLGLSTYCFPVLIFCFYLYLNLFVAREFTYCHIRNVIRLAFSDVSFLQVVVFVVLELS